MISNNMNENQQEKLNSSNQVILNVSTEHIPDMVPIYRKLVSLYRNAKDFCPTLYIVEDLPEGISYIKSSDILLLKRGISLESSMLKNNYFYRESIPLVSFQSVAYDIYNVTLFACDRMNIQCPLILLSNELKQTRGETWQNSNNLSKIIALRNNMRLDEYIEVLMHELRHAWQHEKHHDKFFRNYKFLDTGIDLKDYLMQPAELDAEAFSVRMMVDLGFESYPVRRKEFDDVNKEIETRAKKMNFPNPLK